MAGDNGGFAPGKAVAWGEVAGASALLEEFFDQAQGDTEAAGHVFPRAFVGVVGRENTLAQIHRSRGHGLSLP